MMDDLRELYQEVILDHSKRPRNARPPEAANRSADGHNPLCGDRITVACRVEGSTIVDVGFEGVGCAISQAAASTMTEAVKGKTLEEAHAIFRGYQMVVKGESEPDVDALGKLAVFAGVSQFPMRVKCATLAWHTLEQALEDNGGTVTTE